MLRFSQPSFGALVQEWQRFHFCDWAREKLGAAANLPAASGNVIDGEIAIMARRYPDLISDIRDLYRDWQDGNLGGKDFEARKTSIGNRIFGRRLCDPDPV
jgi:hypothetical protein